MTASDHRLGASLSRFNDDVSRLEPEGPSEELLEAYVGRGIVLGRMGHRTSAVEDLESAAELADLLGPGRADAATCFKLFSSLGDLLYQQGADPSEEYARALERISEVRRSSRGVDAGAMASECLDICANLIDSGSPDMCGPFVEKGLEFSFGDDVRSRNRRMDLCLAGAEAAEAAGDLDAALEFCGMAVDLGADLMRDGSLDDLDSMVASYVMRSDVESRRGLADAALDDLRTAVTLLEEMYGEGLLEDAQVLVQLHRDLGSALSSAGLGDEADSHMIRALELSVGLGALPDDRGVSVLQVGEVRCRRKEDSEVQREVLRLRLGAEACRPSRGRHRRQQTTGEHGVPGADQEGLHRPHRLLQGQRGRLHGLPRRSRRILPGVPHDDAREHARRGAPSAPRRQGQLREDRPDRRRARPGMRELDNDSQRHRLAPRRAIPARIVGIDRFFRTGARSSRGPPPSLRPVPMTQTAIGWRTEAPSAPCAELIYGPSFAVMMFRRRRGPEGPCLVCGRREGVVPIRGGAVCRYCVPVNATFDMPSAEEVAAFHVRDLELLARIDGFEETAAFGDLRFDDARRLFFKGPWPSYCIPVLSYSEIAGYRIVVDGGALAFNSVTGQRALFKAATDEYVRKVSASMDTIVLELDSSRPNVRFIPYEIRGKRSHVADTREGCLRFAIDVSRKLDSIIESNLAGGSGAAP